MQIPTSLCRSYRRFPKPLQQVTKSTYNFLRDTAGVSFNYQKEFISEFFDSEAQYEGYVDEFVESEIQKIVNEYTQTIEDNYDTPVGGFGIETAKKLYAVARAENPEVIVETGVCNGFSSLCFLQAIKENGHGTVHAIDYPKYLPEGKSPGWIIPEELKQNWELTIGKTQHELPRVLNDVDEVDLFMHDTLSDPNVMLFELELAYHHLSSDGVIIVDDILNSSGFNLFTNKRGERNGFISPTVGYIRR